jgi:hypothetical protein
MKSSTAERAAAVLAGALATIVLIVMLVPVMIFHGWVLTKLWAWFIVPQFGLAPLPLTIAIGLSILVNYIKPGPLDYAKDPASSSQSRLISHLLHPVFALLFGWIVTWFM